MIRLLALDMDGTCLNGRSRMTEETIRTIRKAADAGIIIVPTSGRPLTCLPYQMTQEKGLYRYTITSNGAQVVDLEEKKTLFRMLMKRERVVQFLQPSKLSYFLMLLRGPLRVRAFVFVR